MTNNRNSPKKSFKKSPKKYKSPIKPNNTSKYKKGGMPTLDNSTNFIDTIKYKKKQDKELDDELKNMNIFGNFNVDLFNDFNKKDPLKEFMYSKYNTIDSKFDHLNYGKSLGDNYVVDKAIEDSLIDYLKNYIKNPNNPINIKEEYLEKSKKNLSDIEYKIIENTFNTFIKNSDNKEYNISDNVESRTAITMNKSDKKKNSINEKPSNTEKPINILIVSHQSRIRCVLSELTGQKMDGKFKNGAILLLKIREEKIIQHSKDLSYTKPDTINIPLLLFYEGEVNENKGVDKYYINRDFNNDDKKGIIFENYRIDKNKIKNSKLGNYNIFIVRHGEGIHNLPDVNFMSKALTNRDKFFDPELTSVGMIQARKAGIHLVYKDNNNIYNKILFDKVFVSDLYRTKQTYFNMGYIGDELKKPIILPCAHELNNYAFNTSCDNLLSNKIDISKENISKCKEMKNRSEDKCIKNTDWSIYDRNSNIDCSKTNMIEQALQYL